MVSIRFLLLHSPFPSPAVHGLGDHYRTSHPSTQLLSNLCLETAIGQEMKKEWAVNRNAMTLITTLLGELCSSHTSSLFPQPSWGHSLCSVGIEESNLVSQLDESLRLNMEIKKIGLRISSQAGISLSLDFLIVK